MKLDAWLYFGTSGILAFVLVYVLGNPFIDALKRRMMGQYIREDGPQSHQSKAGTPTAGGVLFLIAGVFSCLAFVREMAEGTVTYAVWMALLTVIALGVLGFSDDWLKINKKKNKGLSGYTKLAIQVGLGLLLGVVMLMGDNPTGTVSLFNRAAIDLYWSYPLLTAFIMAGASNAVNLTDGLDGLAAQTTLCSLAAFAAILMVVAPDAHHLDLGLFAIALFGAVLGFLRFNAFPAKLFMGDTGSLALGGGLAALAILSRNESWLLLLAGIFIVEALSVIIQVISFKTTGKRVFKMAPLHHHFELLGWREPQVVWTFTIVQALLCAAAVFLYNG